LLLLFVLKQMLLVLVFPPFTGHDEVAHFSYIRTVATEHRIPIIPELDEWRAAINAGTKPPGDYFDNDLYPYCRYALDWLCAPEYAPWAANPPHAIGDLFPSGWQYAANHPPLYYILAAPFYRLTEGIGLGVQLRLLRLLAIPFGLLVVFGTYLIARTLFPRSGFIAITAATFIAFQPQLSYEAAMVNNDITVIGIGAVFLALLIRGIRDRFPWRLTIWLGVILGVMFLFKSTAIVFAGLTAIAMIVGIGPRQFKIWIPKGAAAAAIALGMASPWYIFLYRTYGNFDALDQVAALQDRWTYPPGEAPTIFSQLFSGGFVASRWNEIWGEFGWRRIPLDTIMLWIIGVACILCAVGLVLYTVKLATQRKMNRVDGSVDHPVAWQLWGLGLLVLATIVGYAAILQFGLRFKLTQARYFFPVMPAITVLFAIGLRTLIPERYRLYGQVALVAIMIGFNIYLYSAYVIPYWYTGSAR